MASLGQSLRDEREARGISLEEIASSTKIVPRYLQALEADRLDLMPGGFFIKGIIRTYAKAVGLDPEAVLERYRAAGLLDAPEGARELSSERIVPPMPHIERPRAVPPPPADAPVESEAAAPGTVEPAPPLLFEETSKPGLSPEARRRRLAWIGRGFALLLVIGAALVLWSPWRHRPAAPGPETDIARTELPPARKAVPSPVPSSTPQTGEQAATEAGRQAMPPGSQPAAQTANPPAAEPAAPKPAEVAPAPAAGEEWKGITIEIVFEAETWIQVYTDGQLQIGGLFPAGATARAQAAEKLLIHTGNAGGFTFRLNGRPAKPLGRPGQVLTDIKITPENLKDFLEAPSSGLPTG
jgi:cytoskeletal protein RodZ